MSSICDRFSRFAMSNPQNTENHVGVAITENGERKNLNLEDLQSILQHDIEEFTLLQVYLRPLNGEDALYTCNYHSEKNEMNFTIKRNGETSVLNGKSNLVFKLRESVKEIIDTLSAVQLLHGFVTLDFIIDDNEHIWLTNVPEIKFSSQNKFDSSDLLTRTNSLPSVMKTMPSLSSSDSSSNNNNEQRNTLSSAGSIATLRASSGEGLKIRNSALISREGNTYHCSLGPDDLPGLRAWCMASLTLGSNDEVTWSIDLSTYTQELRSPNNPIIEDLRKQRSKERHTVSRHVLHTVRTAEALLLGQVNIANEYQFQMLWKEAYQQQSQDSNLSNSSEASASVCGNLHAICRKIESLIDSSFAFTPIDTTAPVIRQSEPRPKSDPVMSNNKNAEPKSSKKSNNTNVLHKEGKDKGNIRKPSLSTAFINEGSTLPIGTGNAANTNTEVMKNIYGNSKAIAGAGGKNIKGGIKDSKKNNNAMADSAPSFEMLAKFAIEKENQQRLLLQSDYRDGDSRSNGGGLPASEHRFYDTNGNNLSSSISSNNKTGKKNSNSSNNAATKSKIKKKDFSDIDDYGIMSDPLDLAEKRLLELERAAVETAQFQQHFIAFNQGPGQVQGLGQGGSSYMKAGGMMSSSSSVISGPEAEFMMRQAQNGDSQSLGLGLGLGSLLESEDGDNTVISNFASGDGKTRARGDGDQLGGKVQGILNARVAALEDQVKKLQGIISSKDSELSKKDEKIKRISNDFDNFKKIKSIELNDVKSDGEGKVALLIEQHMREKILLSRNNNNNESVKALEPHAQASSSTSTYAANSQLMDQLESLRNDNRRQQEQFYVDRQNIQIECNTKILGLEREFKTEISSLRRSNAELEDRLSQSKEEVLRGQASIDRLNSSCKQMQQQCQEAQQGENKLRADLKAMQQSVASSYRLESSQGIGIGVDADTAIRLNEAKCEAKTRQLTNKVDFLKSQLTAEQQAVEDLKVAMQTNLLKIEEMRQEFQYQMREAEIAKVRAVEEAELRLESMYEERMCELTSLQAKMMMLQGQLQETYQESSLLKQREEGAKNAIAKSQAQQAVFKTEVEQLKRQLVDMREAKERDDAKDANKHNQDAMLRRLDNERQYLKNQLSSEITLKNELQNTLTQCQHKLADMQRQWQDDVNTLKEDNRKATQEAVFIEQRLQEGSIQLEVENKHLSMQNKEMKETVMKMRDLIRSEQLVIEDEKVMRRNLEDQVVTLKSEIVRYKVQFEENITSYQHQINALKCALEDTEESKTREVSALRDELTRQYQVNADFQKEAIGMRNQFGVEKLNINRNTNLFTALRTLQKVRLSKIAQGFRIWSTNTVLLEFAKQFKRQMEAIVDEAAVDAREHEQKALNILRKELIKLQDVKLDEQAVQHGKLLEDFKARAEGEKSEEIERLHDEFHDHLKSEEKKWGVEIDKIRAKHALDIEVTKSRCEMDIAAADDRFKTEMERMIDKSEKRLNAATVAAIEETLTQEAAKLKSREIELNKERAKELDGAQAAFKVKLESMLIEHRAELAVLKEQSQTELKNNVMNLTEQHEIAILDARQDEYMKGQQELEEFKANMSKEKAAIRQEMHELTEQRIRDLRVSWEEEMAEMKKASEHSAQKLVKVKCEEHAKQLEAERQRGLKLEASKWRQALKESEKRYELEINKMKGEGRAERDAEVNDEIAIITGNHTAATRQLVDKHTAQIEAMAQMHKAELERLTNKFEVECEEALRRGQSMMKIQLDAEWKEKTTQAVEEAWTQSAELWQAKLLKEGDRLEKLKRDVNAQTQHLAQERTELQERVNKSDEILRKLDASSKAEIAQLIKDFDAERIQITTKAEKSKAETVEDLKAEQKGLIEALEAQYKEITEKKVEAERVKVSEEMDIQMTQLQSESETLITGLENAMNELRNEKVKLSEDLEKTSTKLEDTEDTLFDVQQEVKRKDKAHSLELWRSMTAVQRMKNRFQKGMAEFDKESKEKVDRVRKRMQLEVNENILVGLKLAVIFTEVERHRKKIHASMVSYKTEELARKRSEIKLLEKELERFTMEKDSLEEQRDSLEEEIDQLEGQVKDIEEQIREHNRNSAMQNGRINLAHARKKRRLDSELERILESIEQKRGLMNDLDGKILDKSRKRDEKESEMIDLEKVLVQILVEQQRVVLNLIEEGKSTEEKCRMVLHVARLPWPPPENPTLKDVKDILEKIRIKDNDGNEDRDSNEDF